MVYIYIYICDIHVYDMYINTRCVYDVYTASPSFAAARPLRPHAGPGDRALPSGPMRVGPEALSLGSDYFGGLGPAGGMGMAGQVCGE